MTLEELKSEIGELKESSKWHTMQIGILDAQICAMQKQPEQPKLERWKPEEHGNYWVISNNGKTHNNLWEDHDIDRAYFSMLNVFQTEQEAKQEALRTRARRKLEWLARELNSKRKPYPITRFVFSLESNHVTIQMHNPLYLTTVYFYTKADAEYALSQMTSEELEALR